jgi:hypothetical protein
MRINKHSSKDLCQQGQMRRRKRSRRDQYLQDRFLIPLIRSVSSFRTPSWMAVSERHILRMEARSSTPLTVQTWVVGRA